MFPRTDPPPAAPHGSARVFAALGDETRLRLVARLCDEGPLSLTALTGSFAISRQAITKHLRVMESAGLVRATRCGRESRWQLSAEGVAAARRALERISRQWDEALDRLRDYVEE